MIKVAYLPMLSDDAASFYRMTGVFSYIDHPDLEFKNIQQDKAYNWATTAGCNVLILQRPSCQAHVAMIKLAKDNNMKVISDWDDDLFNVPVHRNDTISLADQKKYIKTCLSLCDEIWVATPALKVLYKPYNRNVHIIPNAHNDTMFPLRQKMSFNPSKLAVYRGGASHADDVQQNINDMVSTIAGHPDWEFRFVGSGITKEKGELGTQFELLDNRTMALKNHTFTMPSSPVQFFRLYHAMNAPVAFFPLVTNAFNRGKSSISFLEATYAGSCYLGNKELEQFDLPFITDISKGMCEPFAALKDDYKRMKRMNDEAWSWIIEHRLLSNINKLRIERLCGLA